MKYKHLEISDLNYFNLASKDANLILYLKIFFLSLVMALLSYQPIQAQQGDSLIVSVKDTLPIKDNPRFSPSQAALYAAILPGLGQAYNRKYWKIPIIYGIGATLGYFIYWNNNRFLLFRDSYLAKVNGTDEDPFPFLDAETAKLNRDYFKKNRELLTILSVLTFGLTIVDATVDAHFKGFDISEELSFRIKPGFDQVQSQAIIGIKFQFTLK